MIAREYGFDSWPKLVAAITSTQPERTPVICSFCGKSMKEVNKIIQGPSVHICNECVDTCGKILSGVSISDWTNPSEGECRFCKRDASLGIQVIVKQSTDTKICNDCVKLCVEVLIEEENPEPFDIDKRHENGMTGLMIAANHGIIETVQSCLKGGANIHLRDDHDKTALWHAIDGGHGEIAQLLKEAGATE